ncbi:MAG: hypothetical protein OIF32_12225, partial [Campylobacterales bacterium]|nr:hypothetical protein [Campylobacterales bacterium]
MLSRFFGYFLKHPTLLIITTTLITLFFLTQISENLLDKNNKLIINSSVEPFMERGSGNYDFFLQTKKSFGSEELIVIAIEKKNLDLHFLNLLDVFEKDLSSILGVKKTSSILSTPSSKNSCIGDSYFFQESSSSICESILERANSSLQCIKTQDFQ